MPVLRPPTPQRTSRIFNRVTSLSRGTAPYRFPLNNNLNDYPQKYPHVARTSPKPTFIVELFCTPSEGVAFPRHFPTPSEGVENAHHRYRHRRAIFAVNLPFTPSEGVGFLRISLLLWKEWNSCSMPTVARVCVLLKGTICSLKKVPTKAAFHRHLPVSATDRPRP